MFTVNILQSAIGQKRFLTVQEPDRSLVTSIILLMFPEQMFQLFRILFIFLFLCSDMVL